MIIASQPKIHVLCEAKGDFLSRVVLSLADDFSCEIYGATSSFKNFLIGWLTLFARKNPPPFFSAKGNELRVKFSPFYQEVLEQLSQIPFGSTISYQELGQQCGKTCAARAVGNACNQNPFPLFIPCHRVICADGSLGGFALDRTIKQRLLAFEGNKD